MNGQLEGRIIAVTGGASGIGAASARMAATRGAAVAVLDIDVDGARQVAEEIRAQGGTAIARAMDVSDDAAVEETTAAIEGELGSLDGLVASAGILELPGPPEENDIAHWDRVIAVNQRGLYLSCLAVGRRMALRGTGSIVTIASVAGLRAMPLHGYAPSKAAVISITQNLAVEWGRSGVRVNAIAPGYTLTPALKAAIDRGERNPADIEDNTAQGRLIEPDEIAEGVLFLLSDNARAISGITLPVDAGWLAAPSWHTYGGVRGPRGNVHA